MIKSFAAKTVEVKLLSKCAAGSGIRRPRRSLAEEMEALVYESAFVEGAAHQPVHGGRLRSVN